MAESKHDDLADALARLAGGDVAPSEHLPAAPPPEPASAPPASPAAEKKIARPTTVRPASTRPTAPIPAAAKPRPPAPSQATAPDSPAVTSPAITPAAPTPTAPPAPGRSARPAAPVLGSRSPAPATAPAPEAPPAANRPVAPAAQVLRKQRPSAPTLGSKTIAPNDAEVDGGQSTGLTAQSETADVIDDDDSVIVPAPDASAFIPRKKPSASAEARAAIHKKKNLEYRRTLIPVLLTTGVLLLFFGVLKFVVGGDSTLKYIPTWIPVALICAAVVLLVIAGANMMSVKQQLAGENK